MLKNDKKQKTAVLFAVLYVIFFMFSAVKLPSQITIKPDILLALACVCPLFCDNKFSAVCALVFGFLTDISVTPAQNFSPFLFLLCAYLMPKFAGGFSRRSTAVCAVCSLPMLFVRSITGILYTLSLYGGTGVSGIIGKKTLPEFFVNLACVIVTYYISLLLAKTFRLENNY